MICPECSHEVKARGRIELWLARTFRFKPRCTVADNGYNPSGWPEDCGCTNVSHGL